jgi:hypothetical protein
MCDGYVYVIVFLVVVCALSATQRTAMDVRVIRIRAKSRQDLVKIKRVASFGTKREALPQHILTANGRLLRDR